VASKRLIFQVVLNDEQGNFKLGKADLPDDVKAKLDELANKLKAAPAGNYIEIEGHTDNTGSKILNDKLGLERARKREALPVRDVPDSAAQDQRDQLRRRQAGGAEHDQGRPRSEPPCGHQGIGVGTAL
jgi:hypothetical protein